MATQQFNATSPSELYANGFTGQGTESVPSYFGTANNPIDVWSNMVNSSPYSTQILNALNGQSVAPNANQTLSLISQLMPGQNGLTPPNLPTTPNWIQTPGLQQTANNIGDPTSLDSWISSQPGGVGGITSQIQQLMQGVYGGLLPQYAQTAFQNALGSGGAASGVPGESATGANGLSSVFGANVANQMLQYTGGLETNLLNQYMGNAAQGAAASLANAGYMSQQDNSITNANQMAAYQAHVAQLMQQQQQAYGLASQNIGYQDANASAASQALLNASIGAAFTPNSTMQIGTAGGGPNITGSYNNPGSSLGATQNNPWGGGGSTGTQDGSTGVAGDASTAGYNQAIQAMINGGVDPNGGNSTSAYTPVTTNTISLYSPTASSGYVPGNEQFGGLTGSIYNANGSNYQP